MKNVWKLSKYAPGICKKLSRNCQETQNFRKLLKLSEYCQKCCQKWTENHQKLKIFKKLQDWPSTTKKLSEKSKILSKTIKSDTITMKCDKAKKNLSLKNLFCELSFLSEFASSFRFLLSFARLFKLEKKLLKTH